jgi:hypothetical protein
MDVTIFYAWQMDRPDPVNKKLIHDAALGACERITRDKSNDWQVRLDSDTQGEAGMCDIPKVILRKIRGCDMFLADLTLVGSSKSKPDKLFPNPNVVFELGYAARHLGFQAMIGVLNEAFGDYDGQIFDIKARGCLKYTAKEGGTEAARGRARDRLREKLEGVFRLTIEKVVIPRRQRIAAKAATGQSSSYTTGHLDVDRQVFREVVELLPWNGAIGFIRTNNFAGFSFDLSRLDDLHDFEHRCDDPGFRFNDTELESIRADLAQAVDRFTSEIGTNTFKARGSSNRNEVPGDWEENNPERFHRVVTAIHDGAQTVCKTYDRLVRVGKLKLGM